MHENKYPIVDHPRDPRFLTLRSLQTPQGRSRTGRYIEGIRHLARAVEHHAPIESIFLDPSVLSNPFGQKLARRLRQRSVLGVRLSPQLYRKCQRKHTVDMLNPQASVTSPLRQQILRRRNPSPSSSFIRPAFVPGALLTAPASSWRKA